VANELLKGGDPYFASQALSSLTPRSRLCSVNNFSAEWGICCFSTRKKKQIPRAKAARVLGYVSFRVNVQTDQRQTQVGLWKKLVHVTLLKRLKGLEKQ
jgi:hypothetical protein